MSNIDDAVHSDIISHISEIAVRSKRKIVWDPVKEEIVGDPDASRRLTRACARTVAVGIMTSGVAGTVPNFRSPKMGLSPCVVRFKTSIPIPRRKDMIRKTLTTAAVMAVLACGVSMAAEKPAAGTARQGRGRRGLRGPQDVRLGQRAESAQAAGGRGGAVHTPMRRCARIWKPGCWPWSIAAPADAAKDFACRQLSLIATTGSVPTFAALLADKDLSHMARYVLCRRIPGPEPVTALRGPAEARRAASRRRGRFAGRAAPCAEHGRPDGTSGQRGRRGCRRRRQIAGRDRHAGGRQGPGRFCQEGARRRETRGGRCLFGLAAERLLAEGKKADALAIYKSLAGEEQPKHVRQAATRGMLAVAGKKE